MISWDTNLALLTDDGYMVVQFDVVKQALEEDVGYTNQIVVLLRLVEWVGPYLRGTLILY